MLKADLHLHSDASDGVLSPEEVMARVRTCGVTCAALTDHDTVDGLARAREAAERLGIAFIPGVEISCGGEAEVHILGYGASEKNERLLKFLSDMRHEREGRADCMLQKLALLGLPLSLSEVPMGEGAVRGRAQIARGLVRKGYVSTVSEAFDKYIGLDCPAYVARRKLPVSAVVRMLREEGCVPVLAHPGLLHMHAPRIKALLTPWQEAGLMGIEAYHPAHPIGEMPVWDALARSRGMLVTGGSDFHAPGDSHADIGQMTPCWRSSDADVSALTRALYH